MIDIGQIATWRGVDLSNRNTSPPALGQPGTQPKCEALCEGQRNSGNQGRTHMSYFISLSVCNVPQRFQQSPSSSYLSVIGAQKAKAKLIQRSLYLDVASDSNPRATDRYKYRGPCRCLSFSMIQRCKAPARGWTSRRHTHARGPHGESDSLEHLRISRSTSHRRRLASQARTVFPSRWFLRNLQRALISRYSNVDLKLIQRDEFLALQIRYVQS